MVVNVTYMHKVIM